VPLRIVEEAHETEVHVELLVAMEKREAGIVGDEINFELLVAAEHDNVFADARGRSAGDLRELEGVAVEMDRVDVVALVEEAEAVAAAFV